MALRSNLAYEKNILTKDQKTYHIGRVKKKKLKKIKATAYISLIITACIVLSFYIMNIVKNTELTAEINLIKNQYRIQQSENIRLKSVIESKCLNASEIEKYAAKKLGMRKSTAQVNYIKKSNKNKNSIELKDAKIENLNKDKNIFTEFKDWIKSFFK